MQNTDHHAIGTPENYLVVPDNTELDTDALTCVLKRASALCAMLGSNFDGTGEQHNDEIISNGCWALDGMIKQARILVEGKNT